MRDARSSVVASAIVSRMLKGKKTFSSVANGVASSVTTIVFPWGNKFLKSLDERFGGKYGSFPISRGGDDIVSV